MTLPSVTTAIEFEHRITTALQRLGYRNVEPTSMQGGARGLRAERETPLGLESVYIACDYWSDPEVDRDEVQMVVSRLAMEPGTRVVILTRGFFNEGARTAARHLGVTLLGGEQLETLFARADAGDSATAAFAAAQAAPATAAPTAATPAVKGPMSETERKAREARRTRGRRGEVKASTITSKPARSLPLPILLGVGLLIALLVVFLVLSRSGGDTTTPEGVAGNTQVETSDMTTQGTEVQIQRAANTGMIVSLTGRTRPQTDIALFRNGAFVARTRSGDGGTFLFDFVPLASGNNTLAIFVVSPGGQGDVGSEELWRRSIDGPFTEEE
jgi:hypothetical protein